MRAPCPWCGTPAGGSCAGECAPTWLPPAATRGPVDWTGWTRTKRKVGIGTVRRRMNGNTYPWPFLVERWRRDAPA